MKEISSILTEWKDETITAFDKWLNDRVGSLVEKITQHITDMDSEKEDLEIEENDELTHDCDEKKEEYANLDEEYCDVDVLGGQKITDLESEEARLKKAILNLGRNEIATKNLMGAIARNNFLLRSELEELKQKYGDGGGTGDDTNTAAVVAVDRRPGNHLSSARCT